MGGRGGSIGGSHGMQPAAKAAAPAAKTKKAASKTSAPKMTSRQALVAKLKNDPGAMLKMSDSEALTAMREISRQTVGASENDTLAQRYMDAIGWSDNKPTIMLPNNYERARQAAGAVNLYHSDRDFRGTSGAVFSQNYCTGSKAYSYNGYFGAGTYWAVQSARTAASYGTHQIKSFLNSSAKVLTQSELNRLMNKFQQTHPATAKYVAHSRKRGYGGTNENLIPIVAAANGYNAILTDSDMGRGSYVITLNRGATTVCALTKHNAHTGMSDW